MTLYFVRSGLAAVVAVAVAVGCAENPSFGAFSNQPGTIPATAEVSSQSTGGTHPIAAFLAAADAGDSVYITLPESGKRVRVSAHRVYFAASGRYCRNYDVTFTNSSSTTTFGLACKNDHDEWQLEKLIVNPSDINAPQRSLQLNNE